MTPPLDLIWVQSLIPDVWHATHEPYVLVDDGISVTITARRQGLLSQPFGEEYQSRHEATVRLEALLSSRRPSPWREDSIR